MSSQTKIIKYVGNSNAKTDILRAQQMGSFTPEEQETEKLSEKDPKFD